jgi:hypothetical protein
MSTAIIVGICGAISVAVVFVFYLERLARWSGDRWLRFILGVVGVFIVGPGLLFILRLLMADLQIIDRTNQSIILGFYLISFFAFGLRFAVRVGRKSKT